MNRLTIENWQQYGDYLLFSGFVDQVGEWIMLESNTKMITAIGKESAIEKFALLLAENNIKFISDLK